MVSALPTLTAAAAVALALVEAMVPGARAVLVALVQHHPLLALLLHALVVVGVVAVPLVALAALVAAAREALVVLVLAVQQTRVVAVGPVKELLPVTAVPVS